MVDCARIAIVGAGWWATDTHIPSLGQRADAELIALCDTNPERLRAAARKYAVEPIYTDVQSMLDREDLDGVVVAASNASHYDVTRPCLERGLHVMLEKPMTLFAADARELVRLAAENECELIVGYPFNFTPYAVRAGEVVRSGELGAVQSINLVYNSFMTPFFTGRYQADFAVHGPDQYTRPELTGGGHGHVQITHAAGLLFFVTGLRPRRVNALMADHGLDVDLVNAMAVAFDDGALGVVSGSGNWEGLTFRLEIGCERGWIDIDARAGRASIHRNGVREPEVVHDIDRGRAPLGYVTAHNLVDVILGRARNGSPPEVGWRAVELLDAAYRSAAQNGRTVTVDELYRHRPPSPVHRPQPQRESRR